MKIVIALLFILTLSLQVMAATIRVPQDQPTIQAGIDAAVDGDTVLVAPRNYVEALVIDNKSIALVAPSGLKVTSVSAADSIVVVRNSQSASIKGFTFRKSSIYGVRAYDSKITITDCEFDSCAKAISALTTEMLVVRNIIAFCSGQPVVEVANGRIDLINNTFHDCWTGVSYQGLADGDIRNNVFSNIGYYSIHKDNCASSVTWSYSDFYDVSSIFVGVCGTSGVGNVLVNPLFISPHNNDFRLRTDSPCRNTGDPSVEFNDPDGTRNDMGALYFINSPPADFDLVFPPNDPNLALNFVSPSFSWTASSDPDTLDVVEYGLYVAIDSNFTFFSQVLGLTTTAHTPTSPLSWGTSYWWKVKALDLNGGETWSNQVFRFKTMMLGDPDGNGIVTISDAVFLINYIFGGGPAPDPLRSGDADCNGIVTISDAVYLIQYIFGGGAPPCEG